MKFPDYGSPTRPLHASGIQSLMRCPRQVMLQELGLIERGDSKAADTGSAVHAAIEAWHLTGDTEKSLEAMRSRLSEFPLADLHDAELSFRPYTRDPRNAPEVVLECEIRFYFEIEALEGLPIAVSGRADQIRADGVWDVKSTDKQGFKVLHETAYQLAMCSYGLNVPVGGIITPYGYRRRSADPAESGNTSAVFWKPGWSQKTVERMIEQMKQAVHQVRLGNVAVRPGEHCDFCRAESLSKCEELAERGIHA